MYANDKLAASYKCIPGEKVSTQTNCTAADVTAKSPQSYANYECVGGITTGGTTNNSTNTNTSTNNTTSTGTHMGTSTTPTEANCIALGKELAYVNGILACKATGGSCALAGKVLSGDTCVASCPNNKTASAFTNTCQETSVSCSAIGKVLSGTTCIDLPVIITT
jgi:hypothetical protein